MDPVTFNLTVTQDEVNFLMAVLGDLPTKSNAFIVLSSIQAQVKHQTLQKSEEGSKSETA